MTNPFLIPILIPLNEFSQNSCLAQIVQKMKKNHLSGFGAKTSFLTLILDYLGIKNFFQKSGSTTFLHLWYLTFIQNFRKILRAVFEQITPRNCLKLMFTPSLLSHAGCQIDHSHNNAIFYPILIFTL